MHKEIITCNVCGKQFDHWEDQEHLSIHRYLGYGSKYDGLHIDIDLCSDCFDDLINYLEDKTGNKVVDENDDIFPPCDTCLVADTCDGWEASVCPTLQNYLGNDDYDPMDV